LKDELEQKDQALTAETHDHAIAKKQIDTAENSLEQEK